MSDVIEVSYTGDLLAHRRCPRAWAYEKHIGISPYEQIQVMEGHLVHHAMEWLAKQWALSGATAHPSEQALRDQLTSYYRVLHGRGIRAKFTSKTEVIERVVSNLYRAGHPRPEVAAAVEGATHEEYPLRSVRKVIPADFGGKSRVLLTGVLDVVIQQKAELTYRNEWQWTNEAALDGEVVASTTHAAVGDLEIWDYKGTRANSPYIADYVRQVVTYAALLEDRLGLPARCVLFFVNEPDEDKRLIAIPINPRVIAGSVQWTLDRVRELRATVLQMQNDPLSVEGGDFEAQQAGKDLADRVDATLRTQCTVCAQRFDCATYRAVLTESGHRRGTIPGDLDLLNIYKN